MLSVVHLDHGGEKDWTVIASEMLGAFEVPPRAVASGEEGGKLPKEGETGEGEIL